MATLGLSADEVLTTTRAVRKRLDFDRPVSMALIEECLQIALQAPSGSNAQGWHFVVVTDREKIDCIAEYYQRAFAVYAASEYQPTGHHREDPALAATQVRVLTSAQYLADNLHRVPALLIPVTVMRPDFPGVSLSAIAGIMGSILPAVWSFMLAARNRGLGTCWTTLHLDYEKEIGSLLGIPEEHGQVALIPIAYTLGTDFRPAPRKDLSSVLHHNSWQA
jgi:nitroreductase